MKELIINLPKEIKYHPDIDDNLQLDEDKRFTFVIKRPSRFLLIDSVYSKSQQARFDYVKMFIQRIENPITLNIEGEKRPFTIDDLLLPVKEIESIVTELWLMCAELSKDGIDTKKS